MGAVRLTTHTETLPDGAVLHHAMLGGAIVATGASPEALRQAVGIMAADYERRAAAMRAWLPDFGRCERNGVATCMDWQADPPLGMGGPTPPWWTTPEQAQAAKDAEARRRRWAADVCQSNTAFQNQHTPAACAVV